MNVILKKTVASALIITSLASLNGCARNISANQYKAASVGEASFTYQGVVASARQVQVEEGEFPLASTSAGLNVGAVAGGLAGATIGRGNGKVAAVAGGALLGGILGAFAEKGLSKQPGMEYVIKLTNGSMMTVVQGVDSPLHTGQRAFVIVSQDGRSRAVPDHTAAMSVQKMRSASAQRVIHTYRR